MNAGTRGLRGADEVAPGKKKKKKKNKGQARPADAEPSNNPNYTYVRCRFDPSVSVSFLKFSTFSLISYLVIGSMWFHHIVFPSTR